MQKRLSTITLFVLNMFLGGALLSALGPQEMTPSMITISDALERTVEFSAPPRRIVLAGKADLLIADILYMFPEARDNVLAIGKTDQGLGDVLEVLDTGDLIRLGKTAGIDDILAMNPDAVFLKSYMRSSLGKTLEATGVPVVYFNLESPEHYESEIRTLGKLFENPERAEEIVAFYESSLTDLQKRTAGLPVQDTLVLSWTGKGFAMAPSGWIQGAQVRLAGGNPVWEDQADNPGWNKVSFEQIAAWDPRNIAVLSYRTPSAAVVEDLKSDALWKNLRAVKSGSFFAVPSDFISWSQPDSRWLLGAQWMASVIHPESVYDDFDRVILSFFTELYSLSAETVEQEILPRIQGSFR